MIKALQEVVDARKDEREACHQSVLAATSRGGTAGPAAEEDVEDIGRAQVASQGSDGAPMHAAGNNSAAAESVLAGDEFGAAAATARSAAEGAGATDGNGVPAQSEWAAADVSAETPANRAGGVDGKSGLHADCQCGCDQRGCRRRCFRGNSGRSHGRGQRRGGLHADCKRRCHRHGCSRKCFRGNGRSPGLADIRTREQGTALRRCAGGHGRALPGERCGPLEAAPRRPALRSNADHRPQ